MEWVMSTTVSREESIGSGRVSCTSSTGCAVGYMKVSGKRWSVNALSMPEKR